MPLSELQKQREREYSSQIKIFKMRDKETGKTVNIKYFGSMVCWDEDGKWYDFHKLELIKRIE